MNNLTILGLALLFFFLANFLFGFILALALTIVFGVAAYFLGRKSESAPTPKTSTNTIANNLIWTRVLFLVLGFASLGLFFLFYGSGSIDLSFSGLPRPYNSFLDFFLYKEFFAGGLVVLFLLIASITSFIAVFKPQNWLVRKITFLA